MCDLWKLPWQHTVWLCSPGGLAIRMFCLSLSEIVKRSGGVSRIYFELRVCNCGEQRLAIWLLSSVILKTPGVGHQRNQYPETQIPLCLLCVLLSWCLWDTRISAGRSGIFPCTVQFVFGPSPQTTPSLRLLKLTVFWSAALQLLFGCDKLQDHVLFF